MNLAIKDIRHNISRFALTVLGVGLLLMIVMGMGGIYRGLIDECTLLTDRIDADLWVVQKNTRGPFSEISRIPRNVEDRVRAVPGVERASGFISHTIQREFRGKPLRLTLQGLTWPTDRGEWLPMYAGRILASPHYEIIVDKSSKLSIGDKIPLGKDVYTVVGLTSRMSSVAGDPMAFLTLVDAQSVQFDLSPETIRAERTARSSRMGSSDLGKTRPALIEHSSGPASTLPGLGLPMISAVIVHVKPGFDPAQVASTISGWPDVTVHTQSQQKDLLLRAIERNRKQLGLFRVLLIIVSSIIMALIIYTLTMEKLHDIAMLKLMGARNGIIFSLILQQAMLLGFLGLGIAYWLGQWLFPLFPRSVILLPGDLIQLAVIVFIISILSSLAGIYEAMKVDPGEVLA
jgi:putative ABC transport system permease protein